MDILSFQLLDIIFRDATLSHVTKSVTRNGKSIMLTMFLALILIYLFSVMGFIFFRDDFLTHIQTKKVSSLRYRSTMTLTRMSIRCRCSRSVFLFRSKQNQLNDFSSRLASTIPTLIENSFCTKENCSNNASITRVDESTEEHVERACDTLFMCIVTTLNKGLRNGGGIGDVLRQPSSRVRTFGKKHKGWMGILGTIVLLSSDI